MNELGRRLDNAVREATAQSAPRFADVLARRAHRRRRRMVLISAAAAAAVIGAVSVSAQPSPGGRTQEADRSAQSSASRSPSTEPALERPEPTYTWNDEPSPVVLRLAERDVELTPWSSCWSGPVGPDGTFPMTCSDGGPGKVSELDSVGSPESVDLWFGMPDWKFEATFTELGVACPRQHTVNATATGDRTFRLEPAGLAGRYQVDLFGRGKAGSVAASFVWTTPQNGPIEQPEASIALVSGDDEELTSYGLEVDVEDLAFHPRDAAVRVTVTAANGRSMNLGARRDEPSENCFAQGSVFFRGDDAEARDVARLGPAPFTYRVVLVLDGREYVGTAVWPRDEIRGYAPYTALSFDPPLPAYGG